jgi:hypothetical protein
MSVTGEVTWVAFYNAEVEDGQVSIDVYDAKRTGNRKTETFDVKFEDESEITFDGVKVGYKELVTKLIDTKANVTVHPDPQRYGAVLKAEFVSVSTLPNGS